MPTVQVGAPEQGFLRPLSRAFLTPLEQGFNETHEQGPLEAQKPQFRDPITHLGKNMASLKDVSETKTNIQF